MNEEELDDVFNVVQRWESLGLLEGLPLQEKIELAHIYDNATRVLLSNLAISKIPKKVSDSIDEVFIPICRRLYKRVGPNFDVTEMLGSLLETLNNNYDDVFKSEKNGEIDPVVEFCIEFADTYEDNETRKNILTDEEYDNRVNSLVDNLREILLSKEMVSNFKEDNGVITINKTEKPVSKQSIRFKNQYVAKNLINVFLAKINKGE
jgi:hypothetical protein